MPNPFSALADFGDEEEPPPKPPPPKPAAEKKAVPDECEHGPEHAQSA